MAKSKMFPLQWCWAFVLLGIGVQALHDPSYTGIKTKTYRRDPVIAHAFDDEQQQQHHQYIYEPQQQQQQQQGHQQYTTTQYQHSRTYHTPNVVEGDRLSRPVPPVNSQNGDLEITNHQQQQQYHHRQQQQQQHHQQQQQQQHQQQLHEQDYYSQKEVPLYQRNVADEISSSKSTADELYTGCPAHYTGQLPYAYDCRRFLNCWNGRSHLQSCGPGTVFNPKTLECDRPDKVVCGTLTALGQGGGGGAQVAETPRGNKYRAGRLLDVSVEHVNTLCPVGADGLHPHPTDCTKFVNCANGNVHVQDCGPGTAFSAAMKVCDFKHKVDCGDREAATVTASRNTHARGRGLLEDFDAVGGDEVACPSKASGLYAHPEDCTKFLNCANGNLLAVQDCGPGTAFDPINKVCDYKEKVCGGADHRTLTGGSIASTSSTTTTQVTHSEAKAKALVDHEASKDIMCPAGVSGLFVYPFDSTKFLNCKNGNTAIQNCMPNKHFSISKGYCDTKANIGYTDRVSYVVSEVSYEYSQTVASCPPGTDGTHLYPYDGAKFIKCVNGQLLIYACPPQMVFSVKERVCLPMRQVEECDRVKLFAEVSGSSSSGRYVFGSGGGGGVGATKSQIDCSHSATGVYPYPFDCGKYLKCEYGRLYVETCPSGSVFSLSHKQCEMREEISATDMVQIDASQEWTTGSFSNYNYLATDEPYLMCPLNSDGLFLHPFDCSKYIRCLGGVISLESCDSGSVFSISRRKCISRNQVEAHDRVEYFTETTHEFSKEVNQHERTDLFGTARCPYGYVGLYPHPYDPTKYYNCGNGKALVETCSNGKVFNIAQGICDFPKKNRDPASGDGSSSRHVEATATTNYGGGGGGGEVQCPRQTAGLYAHPYDCTKYLNCANGVAHIQDCGPGTAWNKEMEVCDFMNKVDCSDRQQYSSVRTDQQRSTSSASSASSQTQSSFVSNGWQKPRQSVRCLEHLNGFYAHPFDATKYIICQNGHSIVQVCPRSTVFSLSHKCCVPMQEVNSADRVAYTNEFATEVSSLLTHGDADGGFISCPAKASGFHMYPFDCTHFVRCDNGVTYIEECPAGTLFSLSFKSCVSGDRVNTHDRVSYLTESQHIFGWEDAQHNEQSNTQLTEATSSNGLAKCPANANGLLPHPWDCTKFLNCANGATYVQDCGPGTAFNANMKICDFKHKVDCSGREGKSAAFEGQHTSGGSVSCPNGLSGIQKHPTVCTKFVNCANGVAHVQNCAPGTAWNDRLEVCDYIANVDCAGRSIPSTHNTQTTYEYSHENRGSKSYAGTESNQVGWQAGGQNYYGSEAAAGGQDHYDNSRTNTRRIDTSSTTSGSSAYGGQSGDRWSHMNVPRPDATAVNRQNGYASSTATSWTDQQHRTVEEVDHTHPSWSGVGSSLYKQTPGETVIYEEGSLQPNRNYATNTYSAPLAPFSPNPSTTSTTTSTTTSNRHYVQPVGFAENRRERVGNQPAPQSWAVPQPGRPHQWTPIYPNTPPQTQRPTPSSPIQPNHQLMPPYAPTSPTVALPTQNLMPPPREATTSYKPSTTTNYNPQPSRPAVSLPIGHLMPPLPSNTDTATDVDTTGQQPQDLFADDDRQQLHQTEQDLEDYDDQYPSANAPQPGRALTAPIATVNESNVYGGLLPPRPTTPDTGRATTPATYIPPPTPTQPLSPSASNGTSVRVFQIYPPTSNSAVPKYNSEPHYSGSYSSVVHSRNKTWSTDTQRPAAEKRVQTKGSALATEYRGSAEETGHTDDDRTDQIEPNTLAISDALRLLLRPYLNHNDTAEDVVAQRAESHIMKLVATSSTSSTASTSTASTSTTTPSPHGTDDEYNADVELIIAGEQHHLIGASVTGPSGTHEVNGDFYLNEDQKKSRNSVTTNVASTKTASTTTHTQNSNWHDPHGHVHSKEFHDQHPHLPNPYTDAERSGSSSPQTHYHNQRQTQTQTQSQSQTHKHNHHQHQHHQHSREYHLRNPHLPNPFDTTPNGGNVDLRFASEPLATGTENRDCQFDCGNGKCVKSNEVCDGINNCGNRNDEQETVCRHLGYEVRLTGGEQAHMGRVEVKILGKWGYVCDDKFGLRDADVLCKELGFKLGASEVRGNSYYPPSELNFSYAMDEVECAGNETSLRQCTFKGWGVNNCGPDEVVGVVCKVPLLKCPNNYWLCSTSKECIPTAFVCDFTPDCADKSDESAEVCNAPIQYRLEGGRSANEGRLEVKYRNEWGTVCDDDFTLKEAQVVCNSLGYYGQPSIERSIFGPGNGPIWLDQVSCVGNETAIDKCNHWSWGDHNCNHTEDVGLRCTAGTRLRTQGRAIATAQLDTEGQQQQQVAEHLGDLQDMGLYPVQLERSSKFKASDLRCGHFKSNLLDEYEHPEERVVDGTVAKRGRHPWQATIRTRGRGGISSHWCGAVLISKKHLLTAAHCLSGYSKGAYFVRMGDHYANIAESSEMDGYIENWYIHEKFRDNGQMNNDIALIVLKHPVRFNDYIQPICLPDKNATMQPNRMCSISGWGSIKTGVSTPSNILRSAQVPLLSDDTCKQLHVYGALMTEGMFCAGYMDESVDACDGDSGGPLVCSDEGGETLYGIISWGQQCGYINKPGVYVRVGKYIDWIYEKVNMSMAQKH